LVGGTRRPSSRRSRGTWRLPASPAFLPQQGGDPAVAVARVHLGQRLQSCHHLLLTVAALPGTLPQSGSGQAQDPESLAPGTQAAREDDLHHLLLVLRDHNYFSLTNRRTRFSSSESASIFFNSVLYFSNSFSRLASLTSIILNWRFQRWKV